MIRKTFLLAIAAMMGTLSVSAQHEEGDITIQPRMQGADEQGFFNVEYAIPEDLLIDPQTGNIKSQLTFRIVASPNTMCPGLYYLRLMKK